MSVETLIKLDAPTQRKGPKKDLLNFDLYEGHLYHTLPDFYEWVSCPPCALKKEMLNPLLSHPHPLSWPCSPSLSHKSSHSDPPYSL